jgi:hypothetical protein
MKVDLNTDEAQALLDGVSIVIRQLAQDIEFWTATGIPKETRDQMTDELSYELATAESARDKIKEVR